MKNRKVVINKVIKKKWAVLKNLRIKKFWLKILTIIVILAQRINFNGRLIIKYYVCICIYFLEHIFSKQLVAKNIMIIKFGQCESFSF